ncbi:Ig domain-containing protein [Enterococcus caccae]|uniref:Uncharacterized protein n=1 Tax=Enterococcus caccae ATCC BAA-1240 TaxID=1158612 RepID=R3WVK9_9ENTE|nr:Ig domain-containing protein [Enterococcus caccae]EOL45835.1 hypothetical protein UC7_01632 [Enterococcus caccae ATCC BAA-1240]EOT61031.1 hypothetical protein I580_01933 [Enterococcus caccae ATCC BAA-1240]OJG27939.1 hypothetical protein RU98_GL002148 [Enterococcus caccae]
MLKKKLFVALLAMFGFVGIGANISCAEENLSNHPSFVVVPDSLDGNPAPSRSRSTLTISGYSHIQDLGFVNLSKVDSQTFRLGTTGRSLRLEAFALFAYSGNILYESHVQDIGWQGGKKNADLSGTIGQSLRIEAVAMAFQHPTIWMRYRAHLQDIGWTEWKRDGLIVGTTGQSRRLEAIEFQFYYK